MNKWQQLAQDLQSEPTLLGVRNEPAFLERMCQEGYAVVVERNDCIIACCFLWETTEEAWRELGSVWVHPDYRGQGFGSDVFSKALALRAAQHQFLITSHPKIVHLAIEAGWTQALADTWEQVPLEHSCGPCNKLPDEHKASCPDRAGQNCTMFYLKG